MFSHLKLLSTLFLVIFSCFAEAKIELLYPQVISVIPHDQQAFTQGLAIHDNILYESTGLYEQSSLKSIDLNTGKIIKKIMVDPHLFAEGIALNDKIIVQITWREGTALVYDRNSLELIDQWKYEGDGWGLCKDQASFLMSNGSEQIKRRSFTDFQESPGCSVQRDHVKIKNINDLECVGEYIYANVWKENVILKIDKSNGEVVGIIDASRLLSASEWAQLGNGDVLNGIAYHQNRNTFWITGKRWPWIFEVKFLSTN